MEDDRDGYFVSKYGVSTGGARFMRIITKEQAKASGRKTYFTGEPCPHGHVCERYVKRSWCVECAREKTKGRDKDMVARISKLKEMIDQGRAG